MPQAPGAVDHVPVPLQLVGALIRVPYFAGPERQDSSPHPANGLNPVRSSQPWGTIQPGKLARGVRLRMTS